MTPITFPATVGGTETSVIAEHIHSIEPQHYYREHSTLVLVSGRRVGVGCTIEQTQRMIRDAALPQWRPQPIATAPRNGSDILGWFPDGSGWLVVWWQPKAKNWSDGYSALPEPTHWLPLPGAPDGH